MNNYFENLKSKPDHLKKRFSFIIAFSFSALILIGWITSYSFIPLSNQKAESLDNSEYVSSIDTPASSLSASVINAWNDFKSLIFDSNKVEFSKDDIKVEAGGR